MEPPGAVPHLAGRASSAPSTTESTKGGPLWIASKEQYAKVWVLQDGLNITARRKLPSASCAQLFAEEPPLYFPSWLAEQIFLLSVLVYDRAIVHSLRKFCR
jgi:hypothetical protein